MKNLFKFGTLGLVLLLSGCEAVSVPTSNTPAAQSYSNQHLLMQKGVDYRFSDYHNFDTSDVYHMGYINMRKATLYQLANSDSMAIVNYLKALRYFKKTNNKS